MRKSHIYLAAVAVATLGVVMVAPATAQDETAPPVGAAPIDRIISEPSSPVEMPAEQQAEYDNWAPDQKYTYDSWPPATQSYYWSLSLERQDLFWRLSDEDKIALTAMTGPERTAAWKVIEGKSTESGDREESMPPPDEPER